MKKKADTQRPEDDRSPLAVGYAWAARITVIGIEAILPILIGAWLDRKFGTVIVFIILGMFLGMAIGFIRLLEIARKGSKP